MFWDIFWILAIIVVILPGILVPGGDDGRTALGLHHLSPEVYEKQKTSWVRYFQLIDSLPPELKARVESKGGKNKHEEYWRSVIG